MHAVETQHLLHAVLESPETQIVLLTYRYEIFCTIDFVYSCDRLSMETESSVNAVYLINLQKNDATFTQSQR